MPKLFDRCPSCGGEIVLTECRCSACQLQLRGDFRLGLFARLSDDQSTFVRVFLRARGNLTEVEKALGISYPTIRNKLEEINQTLDAADAHEAPAIKPAGPMDAERRAVLQKVERGELSAADAVQKLRHLRGGL
jgi:hypothetical protein